MKPVRPAIPTCATSLRERDARLVRERWRLLIDDGPAEGAWNMALDRAIQLAHQAGEVPPTLRLYSWVRPTVTLGRFQDAVGVDHAFCRQNGIDVVRRFTGGRGVLHDDEVTYSLVAGVRDGVPRGTAASYRYLCGALVAAYGLLGVDASLTARPRGNGASAACYLRATPADLSLGAAKLSGSAQVWAGETVLQHGSFTISRDVGREVRVFMLDESDARHLAEQTSTLADAMGRAPTRDEVVEAAQRGVAAAFGAELVDGEPTERELELAMRVRLETSAEVRPSRGDVRTSM